MSGRVPRASLEPQRAGVNAPSEYRQKRHATHTRPLMPPAGEDVGTNDRGLDVWTWWSDVIRRAFEEKVSEPFVAHEEIRSANRALLDLSNRLGRLDGLLSTMRCECRSAGPMCDRCLLLAIARGTL